MADTKKPEKSGKTKSSPATPAAKPTRTESTAKPAASTKASADSTKLVKKTSSKPSTAAKKPATQAAAPEYHPWLDPDRLGRMLHYRPAFVDELFAIVLVVFGMVSLISLLTASPNATLSTFWSDAIRQVFGANGAIILSIMIMAAGVLIALPRIGVHLPLRWWHILAVEIAFFSYLAIQHVVVHDPEPRALARNGQAGGYIGWALGEPVFKLFGSGVTIVFFAAVAVLSLCKAFGVNRKHIQQVLLGLNKRLEAFAERMKRPPQPRVKLTPPARVMAVKKADKSRQAVAEAPAASAATVVTIDAPPAAAPITSSVSAPVAPTMTPAAPPTPRPASALATAPDIEEPPLIVPAPVKPEPAAKPAMKAPPKQRPPLPEKRTRYFTVEDFREVRQAIPRSPDFPPLSLLSDTELNKPTEQEINTNVRIIENTLLEFDIDVEVVDVKVGPTVTQYAVQPFREVTNDQGEVVMQRVRVNKIASLANDLALALAAKRLRIQPYVPGHPYMGIEVPNKTPSTVALRPVMESETFARAFIKRDADTGQTREIPLTVPLGRDVSGSAFVVDLATMPHLLIAGTTGSGKSVCITALTMALIMNNAPDRLNLVMLDPKMVELSRFNGLPHLLGPVETDMERIIGVLRWATREMDRRYKLLEAEAARNIEAYNKALGKLRQAEQLPYIVILVDEIGDLMLTRPDEMERTLTRLAQMARAVGMHLVVATQRPSVDIITGLIKANFPARISFAVASGVDSRVILDTTGAETLMGRGDMLYLAPDASGPVRLQGCFVSDPEIDAVMAYWKEWKTRHQTDPNTVAPWERGMTRRDSLNESDPLLEDAIDIVVREGEASASLIQRRLGIGYPRAAQLLDMLGELGVVGSLKDGGRSREVLMKPGTDKYKRLMDKRRK